MRARNFSRFVAGCMSRAMVAWRDFVSAKVRLAPYIIHAEPRKERKNAIAMSCMS